MRNTSTAAVVAGYMMNNANAVPGYMSSANAAPGSVMTNANVESAKMAGLRAILNRFEISIADAQDLVTLEDYEIVLIVDDSGSMSLPAVPPSQRQLGEDSTTRWAELRETVTQIVDIGCCFDASGIDLFFLNRGDVKGVHGSSDPRLHEAFRSGPSGTTPLTETLRRVAIETGGERPVLLFVLTDGEPNGGVQTFHRELTRLVKKQSTPHTFRVQIMACTGDENAVGYLDRIDQEFEEVDVTDDYYSEMIQVLKVARRVKKFTRGDWCMKAMLGPISKKFDEWDEKQGPVILGRERVPNFLKSNTVNLEEECRCSSRNDSCTIC